MLVYFKSVNNCKAESTASEARACMFIKEFNWDWNLLWSANAVQAINNTTNKVAVLIYLKRYLFYTSYLKCVFITNEIYIKYISICCSFLNKINRFVLFLLRFNYFYVFFVLKVLLRNLRSINIIKL